MLEASRSIHGNSMLPVVNTTRFRVDKLAPSYSPDFRGFSYPVLDLRIILKKLKIEIETFLKR